MSKPQILQSKTVWNSDPIHYHDKIYSLQLVLDGTNFQVHTQWGRRGAVTSSQMKYNGHSKQEAKDIYNKILYEKVEKKGYNREITPAIIPVELGGLGSIIVTKEEQMIHSKMVRGLEDFLLSVENPDITTGMEALFAVYK